MSQFLPHNLPIYYRLSLTETLLHEIYAHRSVNLIGVGGVGQLTYLEFLRLHIHELVNPELPINITMLHLHDFDGDSIDKFKQYILVKKGLPYIPGQHADDALESDSSVYEVLVLTGFPQLDARRQALVIQTLLALCREPFCYTYILASHRPLYEMITDPALRTELLVAEHYFKPASMGEQWTILIEYEKYYGFTLTIQQRLKIIHLTGGHGGLTKALMSHIVPHRDFKLDPDQLLKSNEIHFRVDEILSVYTEREKSALYAIAHGSSCEVPQLCLNHGIITIDNDTISIPADLIRLVLQTRSS